jgi:hypothetical protein
MRKLNLFKIFVIVAMSLVLCGLKFVNIAQAASQTKA